jgi:hypothetical protein
VPAQGIQFGAFQIKPAGEALEITATTEMAINVVAAKIR